MKKGALVSYVILVGCFGVNAAAGGATSSAVPNPVVPAANSSTEKDLLMFFEEKDLVTATKRVVSLRKAPAIATIITADEIRNMGARNLLDVLKMVPGFGISINELGSLMVEVRGIRTAISEKILVMIDGHSLNRNINGSALYRVANTLPMENVKQVEVVRGPGSALYGNSAFVATINVITRNAEEINGLEVKGGGGSFDTYRANMVGGKAIGDKLTASGSLDYNETEGAKLRVEADTLTGTPFSMAPGQTDLHSRQTDAFLKVGYGDLSFRGQYLTKREGMYVGIVSALTDHSSEAQVDNYWGELAYGLRLTEGLSANLKMHYDHYAQYPNMKIYPDGFAGLFPSGFVGKPLVKDRTTGGELQLDWDAFKGNHVIAGFSFEALKQYDVEQWANFNPLTGAPLGSVQPVANWNKAATREMWALYLQDEWQLHERANLTAGVRYDHYSDFEGTLNPRLGLVWSFLENADLKLLYGQAFRAPSFQEMYNINNPVVVGNPDLKPERIKTYEAALAWRHSRFFAANLNYFHSTIYDQIGWDTSTSPAMNANIAKSVTQGIELGLNGALGRDLSWRTGYVYQDPRDALTDRRLPYVPLHRASAGINYGLTKYANLHGDLLWTGTRSRANGDSRPDMPSYATVDLAVTLKNFYRTLELQAAIFNLFDERYKDPDTSSNAMNLLKNGPKVPGDFPREGMSALVTASYSF